MRDCHALAQSAEQIERQGILCRGLSAYRLSRRFDCPAGFAFSRLNWRNGTRRD
jgi:hypothetical protein